MPPSSSHIRLLITGYLDRHPDERPALAALLRTLDDTETDTDTDTDTDGTSRSSVPGRITCSAVVIDRERRVLHLHHKAGRMPLIPGGHVAVGDRTLHAVALREVHEKTGIPPGALTLTPTFMDRPFDIDVHDVEARPDKGEGVHRHYDFRFAFCLTDGVPAIEPQTEEVSGAEWLSFGEVSSPGLRAKLADSGLDGIAVPTNASAPQMPVPPSTPELVRRHAAAVASRRPATTVPGSRTIPGGTVLHVVGVHLYLEREGKVMLGLRHPDSAFAGSTWHFLAGHCEDESAVACLVREAREEAGLVIDPADVELVHVVHVVDRQGGQPRMQVVFRARRWEGAPEVREPDKCVAWEWWSAKDLPEPIVAYTRVAIDGIREGRPYSELGFSELGFSEMEASATGLSNTGFPK
ncbi:NUDIX domain-containing protein [Streptomyces sp. NPDC059352]|uniref:NUDIX domain-containing protein n=1 Tax=Streptomyces sp. NPDC059352 TaxID=3346810 RepID=UPI0036C5C9CE